jgi:hypothetical protein
MRTVTLLCLLALVACKRSAEPDTSLDAPQRASSDADIRVPIEMHVPAGEGVPSGPPQRSSGWAERLSTVDDCVVIAGGETTFQVAVQGAVTSYAKEKAHDVITGLRRTNRNVRVLIAPQLEPVFPTHADGAIDEVLREAKAVPVAYSVVHASAFIENAVSASELGNAAVRICREAYAKADACGMVVMDGRSVRLVRGRQISAGQPPEEIQSLLEAHPEVKRFVVAPYNMGPEQLALAYPAVWEAARATKRPFGDYREVAGEVPPSADPEKLLVQAQSACFDTSMDTFLECPSGVVQYGAETAASLPQLVEACTAVATAPPDAVVSLGAKGCAADPACTRSCAKAYDKGEPSDAPVPACPDAQAIAKRMPGALRGDVIHCHLAGWFAAAHYPPTLSGDERAKVETACHEASLIAQLAPQPYTAWTAQFAGVPFLSE